MQKLIIALFLIAHINLSSQTLDDAVRYSLQEYNSTARFAGVAGSFTALGADVSTASVNPAGIAEFRKSEITFTLNRQSIKNEATYQGSRSTIDENHISLGNISAVIHYDPPSFNVKTFNLAIGFNQLMHYKETIGYEGSGAGTIVERFLELAEGNTPDELDAFEGGPAFDAGAIFNFDDGTTYFSDFPTLSETVFRSETIERSGSLNEVFIALGSNINNKFSWGASLGFPFAKFEEVRNYSESDPGNSIDVFDNLNFDQTLSTTGVGFNLKLGLIYKLSRKLRVGAAFHTKSYYFLTDDFSTNVNYSFTEDGTQESFSGQSPQSEFEYRFEGPWRALAGIGYLYSVGDLKGFISGEIEYVGYTSGAFNLTENSTDPLDQFFQDELNNDIDATFSNALNFKAGTEIAYKKGRIRLGAAIPKGPFNDSSSLDVSPSFSGGVGYRGNKIYVDLAVTLRSNSSNYSPYRLLTESKEPRISLDRNRMLLSLTFGSKI